MHIIFRWRASIVEMMLSLETITIEGLRGRGGKMGGFVVAHACIFPTPPSRLTYPVFPKFIKRFIGEWWRGGTRWNRRVSMGSDLLLLLLLLLLCANGSRKIVIQRLN